ncbi:hypothetical protein AQI88_35380 [Streptomyces cellostaticus]|uniref:Uncharacterized protein n=1 Tax=Streptomyces cellostaticus TaxID=67285 RepID=A0A101NEF6_9ACTN|nr:hypothetical protein [Streptomyces cellostaticus]KUM91706.1 hypothetical protein AQI88_35380 [Streptomyces cellostaticus]GHI04175.1 hypothetical protein Scel_24960 [Streptomyces cellostaticus]
MTDRGVPVNQEKPEVDTEDAEAIAAYDAALRDFTIELNRLHIAFGAPSYAVIAKASLRPKLTKAGLNEALSGKRLPSVDSLLEFVRVVSGPLPPPADAPAPRCHPELADVWRARWQEVKFAQRRAQAPWRRLRDTVRETLDEAYREAQAVRAAAYEEAERIVSEARRAVDEVWKPESAGISESPDFVAEGSVLAPDLPPSAWLALLRSQPFWFAVPVARPLFPEYGGTVPIAELAPGNWYLAVAVNQATWEILAQTKEGVRGLVRDIAGIEVG